MVPLPLRMHRTPQPGKQQSTSTRRLHSLRSVVLSASGLRATHKEFNFLSKLKYTPQPLVFAPLSDMVLRK
ncbi:hypothetical protein C3Y91_23270 [Rhizobium sp. UPM1133]|nr:hypothetical protein [Rhizobium ruizarguesonis]